MPLRSLEDSLRGVAPLLSLKDSSRRGGGAICLRNPQGLPSKSLKHNLKGPLLKVGLRRYFGLGTEIFGRCTEILGLCTEKSGLGTENLYTKKFGRQKSRKSGLWLLAFGFWTFSVAGIHLLYLIVQFGLWHVQVGLPPPPAIRWIIM